MADPYGDVDKHGLATTGRRWSPRGMKRSAAGESLMDMLSDWCADAMNPLIDMEMYLPIILNASRCLDADLATILRLNGIEPGDDLNSARARRLAIVAPNLRAWRGAFRSLRTVTAAMTGGPVMVVPWIALRTVIDESSYPIVVMDPDDYSDHSFVFFIGQGATADYDPEALSDRVDAHAKTVLDIIEYVPCYMVVTWRDGIADHPVTGDPELIASEVTEEYASLDVGPDADPVNAVQFVGPIWEHDAATDTMEVWGTVWFRTVDASTGDFWEIHAFADAESYELSASHDSYAFRIAVDGTHSINRKIGATYTSLGTWSYALNNGTDLHRLDFQAVRSASKTRLRAVIDGNPGPWLDDTTVAGRPSGVNTYIGLRLSQFTTGRLKLADITGKEISP